MVQVWEDFFLIFHNFVNDMLSGLDLVLPSFVDLDKVFNIYLLSDNMSFTFTLKEGLYWLIFVTLVIILFKSLYTIIMLPIDYFRGKL